jgi:hypothetical protein
MVFLVVLMAAIVVYSLWQSRLASWDPIPPEPIEHHGHGDHGHGDHGDHGHGGHH